MFVYSNTLLSVLLSNALQLAGHACKMNCGFRLCSLLLFLCSLALYEANQTLLDVLISFLCILREWKYFQWI
uniref:Uncharacterized protein n=1 Tax=Rhizophora mucronata TaxID=61149 RepID=A0A2P2QST5_RHIMU